jgi:hypothetical protein
VGVGRGAEDDDVEVGVCEERFEGGVVGDGGVVCGGGVSFGGGALQDGVQVEGGGEGDEGDVEDFGGEAGRVLDVRLLLGGGGKRGGKGNLPVAYDADVELLLGGHFRGGWGERGVVFVCW